MDHSALMALAAWNAHLLHTRVHRIDARVLSGGASVGGVLNNETTVALSKSIRPNEWISTIGLKISGYRKGDSAENAESPTFYVEAIVKGIYTWPVAPDDNIFKDPDFAHALGKQIYGVAVCECLAAAGKMGFHGIKIPADLMRAENGVEQPVSKDDLLKLQLMPSERKIAPKKSTAMRKKNTL